MIAYFAVGEGTPSTTIYVAITYGPCSSHARLDKSWLTATPAQRLGFVEPTTTSLLLITVAFRVYHGMKARRDAGPSTSEPSVECSWALDLINHLLSEIPARLLAPVF